MEKEKLVELCNEQERVFDTFVPRSSEKGKEVDRNLVLDLSWSGGLDYSSV